jgi:O-antigen ligase
MTEQLLQETSPNPEQQGKEAAPWYSYIMPVALGAFYLLFLWLDFSYANMTRWPWAPILSFGLLAAAGWGVWQLRRLDRPFRGLGNGLDWAALLWVIALVASTIFSHVPHRSHWYLVMALSYMAGLYALSNWLDSKKKIENLTVFLVSSSLFFSCNSLYKYIFGKWLPLQGKSIDPGLMLNNFPLGHQNFVAGFLVLTLPVATGVAFHYKDWRRWLGVGTVLLGLWDMVSTGSRGGFLGLGAALALGLVFALLIDWSWKKAKLGIIAVSSLLCVVAILWNLNGNFRYRIAATFSGQDFNVLSRLWAWEVGFREWKANPMFGVGIGANPYTFEQYNQSYYPWSIPIFQQLHSFWFQVLAEIGSLGVLAALFSLASTIWLFWKLYQAKKLTVFNISTFCGFIGYGFLSFTDYQLEVPAISMTMVILGGLLIRSSKDLTEPFFWTEDIRKSSALAFALGLTIAITVLIPIHRALFESERGFAAYRLGNISLFYNHLVDAVSLNPNDPYYPLQLSIVMQMEALKEKNSSKRLDFNKRGAFWAEVAVKKMPVLHTYENAGWAFMYLHKYDVAEKFFQKASDIDPSTKSTANLGLGMSSLQQASKVDKGVDAIAKYLFLHAEYFSDDLWKQKDGLLAKHFLPVTNRLLVIYDEVLNQYPQDVDLLYGKAMVYYVQGHRDKALSLLETIKFKAQITVPTKNVAVLPYSLTADTLKKTEYCLRAKEVRHQESSQVNPIDFINYGETDYFVFRHIEGVDLQVVWPLSSDLKRFACTPLSTGSYRFVVPTPLMQSPPKSPNFGGL